MSDNKITSIFAMVVAAIITWGATVDRFFKAGMSAAMIAFALYVAYTLWKRDYIKDFSIDVYIRNAFLSLYGLMIATTLFHLENMQNLIGGEISAMGLVAFTIPFWLILYVGWKTNVAKSIILSFSIWAFLVCAYGMYDYHVRNLSRLVSVYNFATRAGCILVMCIFFTIALLWYYRKKRFQVVLYSALLGLEMISLVLTETRAAFVALAVSGIAVAGVVLFRYKQYISKRVKVLLVLASLFLTVFSAGYSVYIGRESSYRMMGEERPLIWLSTYKMWEDHKILGIGASEWKAAYAGPYRPKESREAGILSHPHNMPLYFLATGGIVGGIGYILYHIFFVMYFLKRTLKSPNDPFAWALFAIFIAYTVNGFLDATIVSKQVARIFYLLLGVSIIFDRWHLREA